MTADAVDELTDGFTETYRQHRQRGLAPRHRGRSRWRRIWLPTQIAAAFTRHAPGRRTANALLATAVVALLDWATTSRTDYRRTRLAALGGTGLMLLDAAMLTTLALAAPTLF